MLDKRPAPLDGLSLRHQVLFTFSAVMLTFMICLAFFVDHQTVEAAVQARGQQSAQDAVFFANLIDGDVESRLTAIRMRAENIYNAGWQKAPEAFQKFLDSVQRAMPEYSWIGFANSQGKVTAATQGMLVGANVSSRPWFRQSTERPAVIDAYETRMLGSLPPRLDPSQSVRFIDVAAPARDDQLRLIGILGAHLSAEWLSIRVSNFASSSFKGSVIKPAVIGKDGALRFGYAQAIAGIDTRVLVAAASVQSHGWMLLTPEGGEPTVYGFSQHRGPSAAHNMEWVTVIPVSLASIKAELGPARTTAVAGVVLMSMGAWLTLYILLNLAGRPVRQLMRSLRQAQDGDQALPYLDGLPREFMQVQVMVNNLTSALRARETDLQKALNELRDSYTGVSETFPGVLFRLEASPEGTAEFTYLSPSAGHYLGVPPQDIPLAVVAYFERPDVAGQLFCRDQLMAQIAAAAPLDMRFLATGDDGVRRNMHVKGRLRGNGRGRRVWHGVVFDVSDLIAAQQAACEADQAKSRFLATMSHEIRTPLNGIMGFAQLLYQDSQSESQRADARKIMDIAEILTRILNDILDFSKIEEGKLLLESRPFRLDELVESSAALFRAEAERHGLGFVVTMEKPADVRLLGDPTRLKQVLNNLLSNAVKFTSAGQVSLSVACEVTDLQHARLRLTVSDTGIGMSSQNLGKLFQRFEQTDASVFRRFGGSGLGLAIVKSLVDAMEGTVAVESEAGQGSMFQVEVPLRRVALHAAPSLAAAEITLPPLHVLVVDDVAVNRELMVRMLRAGGHTWQEAADGQQAVECAAAERFDLILMDIDMPVLDGLQASRQIRALSGASADTPIIALTGYAFEEDIRQAEASGIDAHLAKPIVFAKLKQKIQAVLKAKALA